jgi:hypothetical protein
MSDWRQATLSAGAPDEGVDWDRYEAEFTKPSPFIEWIERDAFDVIAAHLPDVAVNLRQIAATDERWDRLRQAAEDRGGETSSAGVYTGLGRYVSSIVVGSAGGGISLLRLVSQGSLSHGVAIRSRDVADAMVAIQGTGTVLGYMAAGGRWDADLATGLFRTRFDWAALAASGRPPAGGWLDLYRTSTVCNVDPLAGHGRAGGHATRDGRSWVQRESSLPAAPPVGCGKTQLVLEDWHVHMSVVMALIFLALLVARAVRRMRWEHPPQPTKPPGRLVAGSRRAPRGPDRIQAPTVLLGCGQFAVV